MVGGNRHSRRMRANIPKFEGTYAETGFDRECASSNPLTPANQSGLKRFLRWKSQKCPQNGGFHEPLRSLYITNAHFWSAKLTKVFGRLCNYSHFRETVFGDWFDSH